MLTWPWGPMSQPLSEHALRLYVRSGACGDLCHVMPCWPWFVHWLSARWTIATRLLPVSLDQCKTGRSPSWMPPPIWFSQQGTIVRMHNPIASWSTLDASSGASHIPAVHIGLPLSSWNSAVVPCWKPSPDICRRHLTSSALCWLSHAGGTVHQTYNARRPCLPRGFCTCVEQLAVIRRWWRSVASLKTIFLVVVWQWLCNRERLPYVYNDHFMEDH